jgi:hypothetical protein
MVVHLGGCVSRLAKTPKSLETGRLLCRKGIPTLLLQWFIRG